MEARAKTHQSVTLYHAAQVRHKGVNPFTNGHKTRYWCCQDADRKEAQPSQREGVKHRDTLGMHCFNCKSKLNISCCINPQSKENTYTITIWLEHHMRHIPYYDVSLPTEASAMIRENLKWICPSEIAKRVQSTYLLRLGPGHVWAIYSPVMTTVQGVSQRISHGQLHRSAMVSHLR